MKIIDRNGRLFGKISVIDVIVILAVIVVALAIYVKTHKPQTGSNVSTTTVVYQMKVDNQPEYMLQAIQVGDQIYDKERSTGGSLGTITDIQVSDGTYEAKLNDGTYEVVPAENRYNLLLTIRGEGLVEEDGSILLNRVYDLGVNSSREFNNKYGLFLGRIVSIETETAQPQG